MPAADVAGFVAALPKVELHLHLVGSASPDTVLELSRRHPDAGVPTDRDELRTFYEFTGFPHFLAVYRQVSRLVRTGADVVTLIDGLASELAACRVRYAEVHLTPLSQRAAGIGFGELAEALAGGRLAARDRLGLELGWIINCDGAFDPAAAEETVEFAVRYRAAGVVGFGLAGPETGVRRADFAPVFRAARHAGLRSAPHAGETVGPAEVWAAVRDLGAERVGHGIGAAADPALLAHLAERGITLEVCPTSNVCTGAVASLREHPLPELLAAGVPVTLGTDDPGMFHANLNREYLLCHDLFGLGTAELAEISRTGARAAFCDDAIRQKVLAEIDQVAGTTPPGASSAGSTAGT